MWVFNYILFGAFSFLGFDVGFLFSRVVLYRFITSSPMVGAVRGVGVVYVGEWYVCMTLRILICVLKMVWLWGSMNHGKE
jgi:hypothetical protein